MSDTQTPPITREAFDEFIRQLFVCHWVLGQMITGMLERAQSDQHDADQAPHADAYSMIRSAIGEVVDRYGARQIEAASSLIDEVMDAISDDGRIFPPDARAPDDSSALDGSWSGW
ncbi:MAG TPA: hypothetical protein VMA77_19540 [Solirubrobacteraceae bacterium]|nr:hypothetical protein [Solirubrobacteraceae bacterium]